MNLGCIKQIQKEEVAPTKRPWLRGGSIWSQILGESISICILNMYMRIKGNNNLYYIRPRIKLQYYYESMPKEMMLDLH